MSKFAHLRFIQLSLMNTSAQLVKVVFTSLILISSMYNSLYSQNLVPNPSFEEYSCCPNGGCQLPCANDWFTSGQTAEYFNSCSQNFGVPYNPMGFQFAVTGTGYAGVYVYGDLQEDSVRDYISTLLNLPLVIGQKYYVSFWASKVDIAAHGFGCNGLGLLFSMNSYEKTPCATEQNLYPQNYAHLYTTNLITDTLSWAQINGTFVADSAYRYVNIGNFFDDSNTSCVEVVAGGFGAYYYIDDVYVGLVPPLGVTVNPESSPIKVVPNPAHEVISITSTELNRTPVQITLFTPLGELVLTNEIIEYNGFAELNISTLKSGIYYLFMAQNQFVATQKIIIQH